MTLITDAKKRVTLPGCAPGEAWDVQFPDRNTVVLVRLTVAKSKPTRVKVARRGGFTVGVNPRPINPAALAEALAEFP